MAHLSGAAHHLFCSRELPVSLFNTVGWSSWNCFFYGTSGTVFAFRCTRTNHDAASALFLIESILRVLVSSGLEGRNRVLCICCAEERRSYRYIAGRHRIPFPSCGIYPLWFRPIYTRGAWRRVRGTNASQVVRTYPPPPPTVVHTIVPIALVRRHDDGHGSEEHPAGQLPATTTPSAPTTASGPCVVALLDSLLRAPSL